jgi:hypothetical protein
MTCYLFGRERKVADVPTDHPSCSKQHAVLQYRYATVPPSTTKESCLSYRRTSIKNSYRNKFIVFQTCGEGATRWHDDKENKVFTYAY